MQKIARTTIGMGSNGLPKVKPLLVQDSKMTEKKSKLKDDIGEKDLMDVGFESLCVLNNNSALELQEAGTNIKSATLDEEITLPIFSLPYYSIPSSVGKERKYPPRKIVSAVRDFPTDCGSNMQLDSVPEDKHLGLDIKNTSTQKEVLRNDGNQCGRDLDIVCTLKNDTKGGVPEKSGDELEGQFEAVKGSYPEGNMQVGISEVKSGERHLTLMGKEERGRKIMGEGRDSRDEVKIELIVNVKDKHKNFSSGVSCENNESLAESFDDFENGEYMLVVLGIPAPSDSPIIQPKKVLKSTPSVTSIRRSKGEKPGYAGKDKLRFSPNKSEERTKTFGGSSEMIIPYVEEAETNKVSRFYVKDKHNKSSNYVSCENIESLAESSDDFENGEDMLVVLGLSAPSDCPIIEPKKEIKSIPSVTSIRRSKGEKPGYVRKDKPRFSPNKSKESPNILGRSSEMTIPYVEEAETNKVSSVYVKDKHNKSSIYVSCENIESLAESSDDFENGEDMHVVLGLSAPSDCSIIEPKKELKSIPSVTSIRRSKEEKPGYARKDKPRFSPNKSKESTKNLGGSSEMIIPYVEEAEVNEVSSVYVKDKHSKSSIDISCENVESLAESSDDFENVEGMLVVLGLSAPSDCPIIQLRKAVKSTPSDCPITKRKKVAESTLSDCLITKRKKVPESIPFDCPITKRQKAVNSTPSDCPTRKRKHAVNSTASDCLITKRKKTVKSMPSVTSFKQIKEEKCDYARKDKPTFSPNKSKECNTILGGSSEMIQPYLEKIETNMVSSVNVQNKHKKNAIGVSYENNESLSECLDCFENEDDMVAVLGVMAPSDCPITKQKNVVKSTPSLTSIKQRKGKKPDYARKDKHMFSPNKRKESTKNLVRSSDTIIPDEGDSSKNEKPLDDFHLVLRKRDFNVTLPPSEAGLSKERDARHKVREILRLYNASVRKLQHGDESKSKDKVNCNKGINYRAFYFLKDNGKLINLGKKSVVGPVPGVEVGDVFNFRVELSIIGLHRPPKACIDYVKQGQQIIATSIVASECYDIDVDSSDVLIYTGQGGNAKGGDKQPEDQKLERGNLALKNSIEKKNSVRVIRGLKETTPSDKRTGKPKKIATYTYDGLYTVDKCWHDIGPQGKLVYKFELRRVPGQPELAWKEVKKSKKFKVREGRCVLDISDSKETFAISAINTIDDEKPPPFTYITDIMFPDWCQPIPPKGCDCKDGCSDSERCACAVKNGGENPYNHDGLIVEAKPLVYECGPSCKCPSTCYNRVSQYGIKFPLEIFKTESRGWGVRSLSAIPSGSFICEIVGELLDDKEAEQRTGSDEYLFDIGQNYCDPTLWGELSALMPDLATSSTEVVENVGFTIDVAKFGNIGRFINHSCSPNLYAQNVLYDHEDKRIPHIMLFAAENIPPLQELSYHYNYSIDQVLDREGNVKKKSCYCGSSECAGRMY